MSKASTPPGHGNNVILGMVAALLAFFLFTLMNVFGKLLADTHSPIEIAFWRNLVACLPFLGMVFLAGRRELLVIHSKPGLVILRAVLGALSLIVTFAAFARLPLADGTVLMFTSSLFLPVLGVVLLKEHVGLWRWGAILAGFAGVAIMAQPSGQAQAVGVALALCAALMHATLQIILRYLGGFERPETVTLYFFLVGALVTGLAMPWVGGWPSLDDLPHFLGVGLSGAGAQYFLSVAFRNAQAAIVTVFNYSGIVWATILGWLIWGDFPLPVVILGAAIVIGANGVVIWRESRLRRIVVNRLRAKL